MMTIKEKGWAVLYYVKSNWNEKSEYYQQGSMQRLYASIF